MPAVIMYPCHWLSFAFLLALPATIAGQRLSPVDKKATGQTIKLYRHLHRLLDKGILFGHQDDLAYGVGWQYEDGRSDIKDVTDDFPAVYGWELGHLEINKPLNLDSVSFTRMQSFIQQGCARGGVITISWHLNNPLTGKTAWDPEPGTVAAVLPGGSKHEVYKHWLDKVAVFMNGLKNKSGQMIPVIFRPFHELNGNWFWWGGKHCTPQQFKQLWRFTVSYLRDEKQVHHLLYAYNTDRFSSRQEYLEKYPGDEWVDVIGFDIYQRNSSNEQFSADLDKMLSILEEIAKEKNKIPALTEFGGNTSDDHWWTGTFLKVLKKHRLSYVLGWRNAGRKASGEFEYYVPFKDHPSAEDFRLFYNDEQTIFGKDLSKQKIYE